MAISLVQTPTAMSGAGSTVTKTFASSTTSGNLIILGFVSGTSTQPTFTVTDNKSNSYTKLFDLGRGAVWMQFWYAFNITGGSSHTVTINNSGFLGVNGFIREYSGIATTSPVDVSTTGNGSGTSFSAGPTSATTNANNLIVGVFGDDWGAASTYTVGSGFGNLVSNITGAAGGINLEDKIVSVTGTQTATLTDNNSPQWVAGVVAFKGSGGGGTTAPTSTLLQMGVG